MMTVCKQNFLDMTIGESSSCLFQENITNVTKLKSQVSNSIIVSDDSSHFFPIYSQLANRKFGFRTTEAEHSEDSDSELPYLVSVKMNAVESFTILKRISSSNEAIQPYAIEKLISSIQGDIRRNPHQLVGWKCLAEAYLIRGSLASARSALLKCESLVNETIDGRHSQIFINSRLGDIYAQLCEFDLSRQRYLSVLKIDPKNVHALIGMANVHLELSRIKFLNHYQHDGCDHARKCIIYCLLVAGLRQELACTYLTMSEAWLTLTNYGSSRVILSVLNKKVLRILLGSNISVKSVFNACLTALLKAIGIANQIPDGGKILDVLWHDLSVFYLILLNSNSAKTDTSVLNSALYCLSKISGDVDPRHVAVLNTLAMLLAHKRINFVAQTVLNHSLSCRQSEFSCEVEKCNLATLHLLSSIGDQMKGDTLKRANNLYSHSQNENPLFAHPWLGQAYIADKLDHHETPLLYRQSCDAAPSNGQATLPDSQLGLARYVVRKQVLDDFFLPYSLLQMIHYTTNKPDDHRGWYYLSLLSLKQENVAAASSALKIALSYADSNETNHLPIFLLFQKLFPSDNQPMASSERLNEWSIKHTILHMIHLENFSSAFNMALKLANETQEADVKQSLYTCLGLLSLRVPQRGVQESGPWLLKAASLPDNPVRSLKSLLFLGRKTRNLKVAMGSLDQLLHLSVNQPKVLLWLTLAATLKWLKFRRPHLLAKLSGESYLTEECKLTRWLWTTMSPNCVKGEYKYEANQIEASKLRVVWHIISAVNFMLDSQSDGQKFALLELLKAYHLSPGNNLLRQIVCQQRDNPVCLGRGELANNLILRVISLLLTI